jgi:hypothetical protein
MRPASAIRGAAIPETALVLTATLAMVFGIIQIGIIGFLQIMVDGAAFVAAHEYALGNAATAQQQAQLIFPQLSAIQPDANAPNPTSVDVNYGTGQTTQRHGGVGLIRSTHLQMTAQQTAPLGLLGFGVAGLSNVAIHGSAIEPQNLISNSDYDVAGASYTGVTSQVDFYSNMQNAPASYINMENMIACNSVTFSEPCTDYSGIALGTAEFLDHDNWNITNLGIGAPAASYTFGAMLCHQQKFAQAALIFVPETTELDLQNLNVLKTGSGVVAQIYAWDYDMRLGAGYNPSETSFGLYPMHPLLNC